MKKLSPVSELLTPSCCSTTGATVDQFLSAWCEVVCVTCSVAVNGMGGAAADDDLTPEEEARCEELARELKDPAVRCVPQHDDSDADKISF